MPLRRARRRSLRFRRRPRPPRLASSMPARRWLSVGPARAACGWSAVRAAGDPRTRWRRRGPRSRRAWSRWRARAIRRLGDGAAPHRLGGGRGCVTSRMRTVRGRSVRPIGAVRHGRVPGYIAVRRRLVGSGGSRVGIVLAVAWAGDRSAGAARAAIARLDCAGLLACGVVEVGLDRRWGAPQAARDLSDRGCSLSRWWCASAAARRRSATRSTGRETVRAIGT